MYLSMIFIVYWILVLISKRDKFKHGNSTEDCFKKKYTNCFCLFVKYLFRDFSGFLTAAMQVRRKADLRALI